MPYVAARSSAVFLRRCCTGRSRTVYKASHPVVGRLVRPIPCRDVAARPPPVTAGRHLFTRAVHQTSWRYPADMELIEAASAEFERVVRQLPADSWDRPTPSDVSVSKLVDHVVVGNRFTALLLAGVDREEARTLLAGDQVGNDPVAAVADSALRQSQSFAATPLERSISGPNGNVPAAAYLRFRLVDLVVHAWDLLRAAGLDETLDPLIVDNVLQLVEPHLDEMLAFGAYGAGPSGTLPFNASAHSRLLDWFGRRP